MSFVPSFTATQTLGNPSIIDFTDTSSGSDVAIDSRRISLQTAYGTYLNVEGDTSQYIAWALADTEVSEDVLDKDWGLYAKVDWLDVGGDVLYTLTQLTGFTSFNEDFAYRCCQMISSNSRNTTDNNFLDNLLTVRIAIDSGNQAIVRYEDITTAQICYDEATAISSQAQYYLNANS